MIPDGAHGNPWMHRPLPQNLRVFGNGSGMGLEVPSASRGLARSLGFAGKAKTPGAALDRVGRRGPVGATWEPTEAAVPWCPPAPGQSVPGSPCGCGGGQGPLLQRPALPLASPRPWVLAMSSRPETLLNSDSATVPGAGGGRPRAAAVQPPAGSGTGGVCVHVP